MLATIAGLLIFALLGVAVLPVPKVRRFLLLAVTRIGQAGTLATLGLCATCFVRADEPPNTLTQAMSPLTQGIVDTGPQSQSTS